MSTTKTETNLAQLRPAMDRLTNVYNNPKYDHFTKAVVNECLIKLMAASIIPAQLMTDNALRRCAKEIADQLKPVAYRLTDLVVDSKTDKVTQAVAKDCIVELMVVLSTLYYDIENA